MIEIRSGETSYFCVGPYVTDRFGNKASVGARENNNGTKYLQTYADQVWTDNLLSLPECG
jgi:hypothetical protein